MFRGVRDRELLRIKKIQYSAAQCIIKNWHIYISHIHNKRKLAAIQIQRICRGYIARDQFILKLMFDQSARIIQYFMVNSLQKIKSHRQYVALLWYASATKIQAQWRMCCAFMDYKLYKYKKAAAKVVAQRWRMYVANDQQFVDRETHQL